MNEKYSDDKLPDPDSKSQRKRDMIVIRDLGEELTKLPNAILAKCELPDFIAEAIADFKALPNKHGAQRRQLQYIGKLMRDLDDDVLARLHEHAFENVALAKRRFHNLELLRDKLLEGSKEDIADYINQHPEADIQLLNQLVRQARKEAEQSAPPAAARRLFQFIKEQSES